MNYDLKVVYKDNLGYYVTYEVETMVGFKMTVYHGSEASWIKRLNVDKDYYLNTLIEKYRAYNSATYEFPKIFFKKQEDAQRALVDFYEPILIMQKLVE